jgi:SNF2 family DNA or RNA helicase
VGIDLTRAAYVVLYSVGYSLSNYDQFLKRTHRPGQTRPVRYYHMVCEGTVDRTIYKALGKRRDLIESVLARLRGEDDA